MREGSVSKWWLGLCALSLGLLASVRAQAQDAEDDEAERVKPGESLYRTPLRSRSGYLQLFSPLALGRGLRFNNPYRLQSSLGKTAESLSLTASYFDVGLGAVWGPADGLGHGLVVHWSEAVQGIPQDVLTVSYIALTHYAAAVPFARAGIPIVIQPDVNAGIEAAVGSAYMLRAGLGVQGELVTSVYYGAATFDRKVSVIPVVSLELGVFIAYEVLP